MADYNLITPQFNENEEKEKIIIKEYELCFSNKKYSLTLSKSLSNELIFDICNKNISDIFYYKKKFSFEQLKKLDKCFVFYDSLENIIKFIEILLDENKVKLSYENNNLILVLSIFLPTGKKDEIKIFFDKQILNKDIIIEKLIEKINNLENSINTVIQNNQKKDEIIQLLEKRIHKLEEKEKERETSIKKSSIVLKNELNILLNEFQNHYIFKNKNIKFKLLYKASKDGHFINISFYTIFFIIYVTIKIKLLFLSKIIMVKGLEDILEKVSLLKIQKKKMIMPLFFL